MKRLALLLGIAGLIVAFVLMARPDVKSTAVNDEEREHPLLAAGLKEQLNDIDKITITRGDKVATVEKHANGSWHVKELFDYPASTVAIRKALFYMSQSELRDRKTNDPTKLARLRLDDKQVHRIALESDGKVLHKLMLGRPTRDATNTYARIGDNPQSYVVSGRMEFKANPHDWLFYDLFAVSAKRVKKIAFAFKGKQHYAYNRKNPDDKIRIEPLPKDKKMKKAKIPVSPITYYQRLAFTDVLPQSEIKDEPLGTIELTTFDGLIVTITYHRIDFEDWAQITTRADEGAYRDDLRGYQPYNITLQEADAINNRTRGWLYKLGQYQYNNFTKSYYDLVEDKQP